MGTRVGLGLSPSGVFWSALGRILRLEMPNESESNPNFSCKHLIFKRLGSKTKPIQLPAYFQQFGSVWPGKIGFELGSFF